MIKKDPGWRGGEGRHKGVARRTGLGRKGGLQSAAALGPIAQHKLMSRDIKTRRASSKEKFYKDAPDKHRWAIACFLLRHWRRLPADKKLARPAALNRIGARNQHGRRPEAPAGSQQRPGR